MTLYLVGNEQSAKHNDWIAICKTRDEAERMLDLFINATMIKEVKVA